MHDANDTARIQQTAIYSFSNENATIQFFCYSLLIVFDV